MERLGVTTLEELREISAHDIIAATGPEDTLSPTYDPNFSYIGDIAFPGINIILGTTNVDNFICPLAIGIWIINRSRTMNLYRS
eukprot:UN27197